MSNTYDLVIIGGGPAGYVAAIRATQLGLSAACVEEAPQLGGTCLRIGCIPSKAILESSERYYETAELLRAHGIKADKVTLDLPQMHRRKQEIVDALAKGIQGLFLKHKVARFVGRARFETAHRVVVEGPEPVRLNAGRVIVATGSRPALLPGIECDGDRIGTSTEALCYTEVPKHLVVIGAGYIGLELGSAWNRFGARVTVLEYLDRILPGVDSEIAHEARKMLGKQGLNFQLGARVTGARIEGDKCIVEVAGQKALQCDRVLVAVGRSANTENLGLERIGVALDEREHILVNDDFMTTIDDVYAIGDVIRGPMLAHKAEEEGVACVEKIVTGHGHVHYNTIPGVVYTHPEIATVGKTEDALREEGVPYAKGSFPFGANGRARTLNEHEGRVKVLAHAETDRILGVHIIGPRAGDLIAEAVVAMELGAASEDLARICHAHPTLAEGLREAALAVEKRAIHI